jgi:DNA-binding CsgD family transcriptional regulator
MLSGFLSSLANSRDPSAVVSLLLDGPFRQYEAKAIWLSRRTASGLQLLASSGFPTSFEERYHLIHEDMDTPATAALRSGQVLQVPLGEIVEHFPQLKIDESLLQRLIRLYGPDSILMTVPAMFQGRPEGVCAVVAYPSREWEPQDYNLLLGVAGALGLWIVATHGEGVSEFSPGVSLREDGEIPLLLTPRQLEILMLAEQGKSNAAIAATLGYSVSTIKVELRRTLRALRAKNRNDAIATARHLNLLREVEC